MKRKTEVMLCLFVSFVVSFIVMTIVTDYLARQAGFYAPGIADSESLDRGEF